MKLVRKTSALVIVVLAVSLIGVSVAFMQRARRHSPAIVDGSTIKLDRNGDFQRALNSAKPGDTIVLEAGAAYTGPFTLPVKSGEQFVTIQSSRAAELPEGVRVTPSQSALFAKLQSSENGTPIVRTAAGAHHYKFIGIEFSTAGPDVKINDLVRLGESNTQTTLDAVPHNLIIDRSFIHGFPTQDVQRGISLNSRDTDITNSHISDIHGKGFDTQAICGWNGPGPFNIINNYLEGAGENIMFGGSNPSIPELVPTKIVIRDNHVFKPMSWKVGDPTYGGQHWSVKNLFELKNARDVTVDRNVFENNWTDAQAGSAILFTVRNDEGGAPWSIVEDVRFTNNIVRNSPAALNLLGKDDLKPSKRSNKLEISNNLFYNINGTFLMMSGYPNVTVRNNTHIQTGNVMTLHGEKSENFVYEKNLTIRDSKGYGVKGDNSGEGTVAVDLFTPGARFLNNVIAQATAKDYPANNAYPSSASEIGFEAPEKGDYRLSARSRFRQAGADFSKLPKLNP
jgi:hypothetical protein